MYIFNKWIIAAKTHKEICLKNKDLFEYKNIDLDDFVNRPISDVLDDLLKEQEEKKKKDMKNEISF